MSHEERLAAVLQSVLETPNECDSNFEPANVVDGLYRIARAIDRLADAVLQRED